MTESLDTDTLNQHAANKAIHVLFAGSCACRCYIDNPFVLNMSGCRNFYESRVRAIFASVVCIPASFCASDSFRLVML